MAQGPAAARAVAKAWAKGPVKLARAAAALGQEVAGGQLLLGISGQVAALPNDLPPAAAGWRNEGMWACEHVGMWTCEHVVM